MLRIEFGLCVLAVLIASLQPQLGSGCFVKMERRFAALARHRTLSVILVGVLALALRAVLLPIEPIPEPIVHDEFAYLLAADTFAHGRLTNPTHPMWVHFESFGIIHKPTYQCIAQPAQGLVLALGTIVFGHPFWGVWLSAALMCAAITWMLQAWLPEPWALLGGLIAVLRYATFSYWANSYFGGALGALGAALVLGALPRIKELHRIRDAAIMAAGLAVLANSRPYEGFVFSLPVGGALLAWLLGRKRPPWTVTLREVVLPFSVIVAVSGFATGYYLWRVTGNPFRMPYQLEREQYSTTPYILWHPRPTAAPVYHHEVIRRLYAHDETESATFLRSPLGAIVKSVWFWRFYVGPVLTLPVVVLAFTLPRGFRLTRIGKRTKFLVLLFVVMIGALAFEIWFAPHYASPMTCVLLALILLVTSQLRKWSWRGRPSGLALSRAVPVICAVMFLLRITAGMAHIGLDRFYAEAWYQLGLQSFGRGALVKQMQQLPGRELVIVRYKPDHLLFNEWVYNDADIDRAKVVWARNMNEVENRELINYFSNRNVWVLDADQNPPQIQFYKSAETATSRGYARQPK